MDTLISSALEEICCRGVTGISVTSLWTALTTTLTPSVKSTLWTNLLSIPTLQFTTSGKESTPFSCDDPRIQRFEDADAIGVKIVAKEHLRDCFVGLYDCDPSSLVPVQRRALDKLAFARGDGVVQTDLSKEVGGDAKMAFYHVRKLMARGLVVKQPAVLKTKESGDGGEVKNSSAVTTSLVYLYRYAKHLGVQQRIEVNKGERSSEKYGVVEEDDLDGDGLTGESLKDDVLVKDYLPAMKDVCDKLERANNKVLVISDIKRDLGYSGVGSRGHKAWRTLMSRLKDGGFVEDFDAQINEKVHRCLRLVRSLCPNDIETRTLGCEDVSGKETLKFGRSFQQTEELKELPIDHQIYDIINAAGKDGVTAGEVSTRLGLDKKKTYSRIHSMIPRFGMHQKVEQINTNKVYKIITHRNFKYEGLALEKTCTPGESKISSVGGDRITFSCHDYSTSEVDYITAGNPAESEIAAENLLASVEDGQANCAVSCDISIPESQDRPNVMATNNELALVSTERQTDATESETGPLTLWKSPKSGSLQMYPFLPLTADGALREQRVLTRLQEDKFILQAELHNWLLSFEKSKKQTMDRKTVERILNKLREEGHCKCVDVNVPLVTDCGRNRICKVVLHPSVQTFPPELAGEIHERWRYFDKQVRSQPSSKLKVDESIPVMNGVMRMQPNVDSDDKVGKAEIMRANGFVLARMVRAKLLHCFLWEHLNSLPEWESVFSTGNLVHSYILFSVEAAMKAIPLELFLQVAGCTQKLDDLIEKCMRGLRLSDLSAGEYKCLMDTGATGRLSSLIDILLRLKLIRLVRNGHLEATAKAPHATLTHALELKPYVEEPLLVLSASNSIPLDLRPTVRHDFVLSNRDAVDEYWKTLEFCYAVAHPKAALHAFPGSAVPEVFIQRSWSSVRVMSTEQRAALFKRLAIDDPKRKLSFKECEKIAKDLNLTLQQVLRCYYDKYYRRLTRFQCSNDAEENEPPKRRHFASSKRKKNSLESAPGKRTRVDGLKEQSSEQGHNRVPHTVDQFLKEQDVCNPKEHDVSTEVDDHCPDYVEEEGQDKDGECYVSSSSAMSKMNPTRRNRFLWTDEADRKLVIEYVRHRAVLGAKFNRAIWSTLPDLPAPPDICKRKMAYLKRIKGFRKALNRLCTVLSDRYANQLKKTHSTCLNEKDSGDLVRCSTRESLDRRNTDCVDLAEECWDDFNNKNVKEAFDDVIRAKQMAKFETSKRVSSTHEEYSHLNMDAENSFEFEPGSSSCLGIQNFDEETTKASRRSSGYQRLYHKVIKLLNERSNLDRQVHKSLAVSNAVELLKLVFLSKKSATQLPNLLAETLRRYSEHDLYAAFSYLREKRIMVGGDAGEPYVLSLQFLRSISRSPFPPNTGKRALKFSSWLHSREKDLIEVKIDLPAELQCGDIFYLFALISFGELSFSPSVPCEGVGEAEDSRSLKRKAEDDEFRNDHRAKILKSCADSELISRREKGFPGVAVAVQRTTIPTVDAIEIFTNRDTCTGELPWNNGFMSPVNGKFGGSLFGGSHGEEIPSFDSISPAEQWSGESTWEAMAFYAKHLMPKLPDPNQGNCFSIEVFTNVCTAIKKAGDQGLSMEELSQVVGMPGEKICEHIVDVLQKFGRALKVNAYNGVHVVDTLYRSKYFVTFAAASGQDFESHAMTLSLDRNDNSQLSFQCGSEEELRVSDPNVHKISILNQPEEIVPVDESQGMSTNLGQIEDTVCFSQQNKVERSCKLPASEISMPILPWINGDGTINKVVYGRFVRSVLGIVMQNPGILENDLIQRIDALNPQSCRTLLEQMILEKHVIVRNMYQSISNGPPALLSTLSGANLRASKSVYRKHLFANPKSTFLL